jgi:hypothetical protein|tara:strand:- start:1166 stop:1549 length:384 start_codon:yes stop_codon:yes gene_type:complete
MSNFECSVKDLMAHSTRDTITPEIPHTSEHINTNVDFNREPENTQRIESNQNVNLSLYQILYTDKNIKMVLFITLVYLTLNSEQMFTFLSNNAPFLITEGLPGFLGKAAIGLMLGIIIIIFNAFFLL